MATCRDVISNGYTDNCIDGTGGNYDFAYIQTFASFSAINANSLNIITGVTMSGSVKCKQIAVLTNGCVWESSPEINAEDGTKCYKQKVTLKAKGINTTLRNIMEEIGANKCVLFLPKRDGTTGTYWCLGGGLVNSSFPTGGGLPLTSNSKMQSGAKPTDYAGITFEFEGEDSIPAREVVTSVIATII